jgi:hypothetical protein
VCAQPLGLSSHSTPRVSAPRLSITSGQIALLAALELDLPPFCTTMNISNMSSTAVPRLYLCLHKDGSPYDPPATSEAWNAPAMLPSARLRRELPIPPSSHIFFLDPDLAKTTDHGFKGFHGIRPHDYIWITGKTTIKGGGQIGDLVYLFKMQGCLWQILKIHGWMKERGASATRVTSYLAMTDGHEMCSSPTNPEPHQWLISLS